MKRNPAMTNEARTELHVALTARHLPMRALAESPVLVARYVDESFVALLSLGWDPEGEAPFEQFVDVYQRQGDASDPVLLSSAGTDWYGPIEARPPCEPLWFSGFEVIARHGQAEATFATGFANDRRYRAALRNFASGEPLLEADAPMGPFIVRLR